MRQAGLVVLGGFSGVMARACQFCALWLVLAGGLDWVNGEFCLNIVIVKPLALFGKVDL